MQGRRRVTGFDGGNRADERLLRQPVQTLSARPLDSLIGTKRVPANLQATSGGGYPSSSTPTITAENIVRMKGLARRPSSVRGRSIPKRMAGTSSSRIPWLCVAAIPAPSHSSVSLSPAYPSHGRSCTSSTNIAGTLSPSETAVVTIRSTMPRPDPKCLTPVIE